MFVVMGVSGHTGSVVASALLAQGKPVRVVVRDEARGAPWKARGAEVAVASLSEPSALAAALRGAEGAYLLVPPSPGVATGIEAALRRMGEALVEAVRQASPRHVVFLSSIGVQHEAGTGPIKNLGLVERGLAAAGVPATFLRAAYFHENWGAQLPGALAGGAIHDGVRADLAFAQVATSDIGEHAARLLLDPVASGTRVVELSGPADASVDDVAALISRLSGKEVKAVTVPIAGLIAGLEQAGLPAEMAALYGEMADGINRGLVAFEGGRAVAARGRIGLEQTLRSLLAASPR